MLSYYQSCRVLRMLGACLACWVAFFAPPTQALILTGKGNAPVHDPGWPAGALEVANLKTRVSWMEGPPFGGGQWTFFYRGDTDALRETVEKFSKIESAKREIVLHEGPGMNPLASADKTKTEDGNYDWSFEVWVPERWNLLYNNSNSYFSAQSPNFRQPVAAPRLDIWLMSHIDWAQIAVPKNITIRDDRASAHGFGVGSGSAVRARILDAESGKGIKGAQLAIKANQTNETVSALQGRTDEKGAVEISGVPPGTYPVIASAEGYAPKLVGYARFGANDFTEYIAKLSPATTLEGVVIDEKEHPLAGVRVRANNTLGLDGLGYELPDAVEMVSGDDGSFRLTGIPAGSLQVWAYREGYHHKWEPSEIVRVTTKDVNKVTVRMEAAGVVRVQLLDKDGAPVSKSSSGGAEVHIQQADRQGVGSWGGGSSVNTNGTCEFKSVPPGKYRLSTRPFVDGIQHDPASDILVTVQPNKTTDVVLRQQ